MSARERGVGALCRLEALCVLALGLAMGALATSDRYGALMNPAFRWVTLTGALLIAGMGVALLRSGPRVPNRGALVVFGLLFGVVAGGRPLSEDAQAILPPTESPPQPFARAGYTELELEALFEGREADAEPIEGSTYFARGRLYRTPELEERGQAILLFPMMACCLADALAFGVRVKLPSPAPQTEEDGWYYVLGRLRRLEAPVVTEPFRFGSIRFTTVSEDYELDAAEIKDFRTQLPGVVQRIPGDACSIFLRSLEDTGLADELGGEGPFTLFAPMDEGLRGILSAAPTPEFDPNDRESLRRYLETFVVRGSYYRSDLFQEDSLESLSGAELSVEIENGRIRLGGARILFGDQLGRNGMLHIVHPAWPPGDR